MTAKAGIYAVGLLTVLGLFPIRDPVAQIMVPGAASKDRNLVVPHNPGSKKGRRGCGDPSVILAGVYDVPAAVLAVPSHRGIAQLTQGLQNVAVDGWVTVFVGVDPFVAERLSDAWHHGFLVNGFFSVDRIEDPLGNFWCIGHLLRVLVRGTQRTPRPHGALFTAVSPSDRQRPVWL